MRAICKQASRGEGTWLRAAVAHVGTGHLLLGLIREEEGVAARVLENLGLRLDVVREEVLNLLGEGQAIKHVH